jgi:acetyl esterase
LIGDLDTHDRNARGIAAVTGTTVMSVAYRLAPESPYPASVDDALNAVRAGVVRASELRVDSERLFVAGDSAGGTLALVAALAFKDRPGAKIVGVAAYPAIDFMTIGR